MGVAIAVPLMRSNANRSEEHFDVREENTHCIAGLLSCRAVSVGLAFSYLRHELARSTNQSEAGSPFIEPIQYKQRAVGL
jgi:hypothetical protein